MEARRDSQVEVQKRLPPQCLQVVSFLVVRQWAVMVVAVVGLVVVAEA